MQDRHAKHPFVVSSFIVCAALLTLSACSDGDRSPAARLLPTSPSVVSNPQPTGSTPSVDAALRAFPGRALAYQFRRDDLEQKYRAMGRSRFSTFVDPEGSVIWVGEYLRYRAAECSHTDAFNRVAQQIGGGGVPPVCGQNEREFPGRAEALQFRRQLEGVYQARGAGLADTAVDDEGDVIWTMEYYRYVLSGCSHTDTVQKIINQIDGRGVAADCTPPPVVIVPPVLPPTAPLTGAIAVQNTPCVAPATGSVSCRFAASASGGQGPYAFSWSFAAPLSTATATGQQVSPDLGCSFSAGVVTFNVTIALTVTPASGSAVTVSGSQQIARAAGACGT